MLLLYGDLSAAGRMLAYVAAGVAEKLSGKHKIVESLIVAVEKLL